MVRSLEVRTHLAWNERLAIVTANMSWFGRTDFLLIRDSAGRLSVREFTGAVLAGQEEPRIRVPPPRSKEKK